MEQFDITLKNERTRFYNRIALFIILINVILLTYFLATGGIGNVSVMGGLFWFVTMLVIGIFYFIAKKKLIMTVRKEQIVFPSFPAKKINWFQLSGVILKDGLLTIDFKNNRLIQQPVDESFTAVNEAEFNEFCRNQIQNGKIKKDR